MEKGAESGINAAGLYQLQQTMWRFVNDVDTYMGMVCLESLQYARDGVYGQSRSEAQTKLRRPMTVGFPKLYNRIFQFPYDSHGCLLELTPGLSECYMACCAFEQVAIKLVFQFPDGRAEGRLTHMELLSCFGEVAYFSNAQKSL